MKHPNPRKKILTPLLLEERAAGRKASQKRFRAKRTAKRAEDREREIQNLHRDGSIKRCPSFPGYSAGEDGVVYSYIPKKTPPFVWVKRTYAGSGYHKNMGYQNISVCMGPGKMRMVSVHIMVADAFIGPRPHQGMQVRHLDCDGSNNHASNLRYGTAKENQADSRRVRGENYRSGQNNANAKVSLIQSLEIAQLFRNGEKVRVLRERYKLSKSSIYRIAKEYAEGLMDKSKWP